MMESLKIVLMFVACWTTAATRIIRYTGELPNQVPDINSVQEFQNRKPQHQRLLPAISVSGNFEDSKKSYYSPEEEVAKERNPFWALVYGEPRHRINRFQIKAVPFVYPSEIACKEEAKGPCKKSREAKYRSLSGYCNNKQHPDFGSADTAMPRLLNSIGDRAFFNSDGSVRPNPRQISLRVRELKPRPRPDASLMVMQFGQFIDHDHVITETVRGPDHKPHKCRPCSSWMNYPDCAPIPSEQPSKCIEFTRNARDGSHSNLYGQDEQINRNTAFLDLSTVYGSSACTMGQLRLFDKGLMQTIHPERDGKFGLLPLRRKEEFEDCRNSFLMCFFSGDNRANEHNGLLVLHTILVNEHNRLAEKLQEINAHWDDERLFQEARKIHIAQIQHVVYNEFLPVVLGEKMMNDPKYNLKLGSYSKKEYDIQKNPGVLNEFATAAFRFGHSLVPERFHLLDENFFPKFEQLLVKVFFNTVEMLQTHRYDPFIRGLLGVGAEAPDLRLNPTLTDRLFEEDAERDILDLFAINVARGRDHGLPGYVQYRALCRDTGEDIVLSWDDLLQDFENETWWLLKDIYKTPHDIDLFVGGLGETLMENALVGPTFGCIIAHQYHNTKYGDEHWYENPLHFTKEQQEEIRKTLFSRLVCRNMNNVNSFVTRNAFRLPSKHTNPKVNCADMESHDVDLSHWLEDGPIPAPASCVVGGRVWLSGTTLDYSKCATCTCYNGQVHCRKTVDCKTVRPHFPFSFSVDTLCNYYCGEQWRKEDRYRYSQRF